MERSPTSALAAQQPRPLRLPVAALLLRPAVLLVCGAAALAGLSLLLPSAPTYDPWAWIIWGREIAHLDLQTTGGPSWKPLPVLFTTVFSVFGSAAPELWLVVARAGALLSLAGAFVVVRRLGGGWIGGLAAAVGIATAPWFMRNAAYGNSEPLLICLLLWAVERELAGERRAAWLLGVGAALLRPEAWPFLALYTLFLLHRRELRLLLALAIGALVLALWTLPELWGSGDLLRAAHRAQTPNADAATFADDPALQVFHNSAKMLTIPVIVGVALAGLFAWRERDRRVPALAILAFAWTGLVAYMTASEGFSGNNRYLIPGVTLAIVLGGLGVGRLAAVLPRRRLVAAGAALVAVVAFAWVGVGRLERTANAIEYQANLINTLPQLVAQAGGAERLQRCGDFYTGPFLVPAVAWHVKVHTLEVGLRPRAPAVVFRERTDSGARRRVVPPMYDVKGRNLALAPNWRIVAECRR